MYIYIYVYIYNKIQKTCDKCSCLALRRPSWDGLHQGLFKQPIHENEEHELEEPEEQELEVEIATLYHIVSHCITLYHIVTTHHIRFVVMQISTGDSRHWKGILQAEHLFEHCVFKQVEIWIGPKLYELVSFIKVPKAQVPPLVPLFQTGQIFCTRCLHQGTFRLRCYFLQQSVVTLCHGHHFAMCPFQEEEEDDLVSRAICSAVADCKYSVSCLIAEQAVSWKNFTCFQAVI